MKNQINLPDSFQRIQRILRAFVFFALAYGLISTEPAFGNGGNWLALKNNAKAAVQLMIQMSDGSVLAANNPTVSGGGPGFVWYQLEPDPFGHYALGNWSDNVASMHDPRLFYSSQLLQDGRLFVAGGEYGTGYGRAEIYDPVANIWTQVNPPASLLDPTQRTPDFGTNFKNGLQGFYDSDSTLLPDGTVLIAPVGPKLTGGTLIYNPFSNTWTNGATPLGGNQDEASWVTLPDHSVLTVDPFSTNSERYIPSLTNWVPDAKVPVALYSPIGDEIGAALLLPNGKAFFLGGSGHTAIYTPSGYTNAGSWVQGPDIPNGLTASDAPAVMMQNGIILCAAAGPTYTNSSGEQFPSPTSFFEYDYSVGATGAFTQVNGPTGQTDDVPSFPTAMLALADGTVLFTDSQEENFPNSGAQLYIYIPIGGPLASEAPEIDSITPNPDGSFNLKGRNLNGFSDGAAYGDDAQMNTDYPIVEFMDTNNNHVDYARTYNWTTTQVYGGQGSVDFTLSPGLLPETYLLYVIANGIPSAPVTFSFINPSSLALCPGDSGTLSVTTSPLPATYQWYFNGVALPDQTNTSLTINNATTNDAGFYSLIVRTDGRTMTSLSVPVSVGVMELSQPVGTNVAPLCQYAELSVVARGKGNLTVQWFHDATLIVPDDRVVELSAALGDGSTQFTLAFNDVHYIDDATYHVVITDDCGPVVEPPFAMRVNPNPPWTLVATNGPSSRASAATAYDTGRSRLVLFGGLSAAQQGNPLLGDTWEYDGTNWTQRFPSNSPPARDLAQMVYDSHRHRSVLFGGQIYSNFNTYTVNDTWEWDGLNWTNIQTPNSPQWTSSDGFAACYDSVRAEMLIFGGITSAGRVSEFWGYDGTNWTQKNPEGPSPTAPNTPGLAFDSSRSVAVLLGANSQNVPAPYQYGGAVWEWTGTNWDERRQSGQIFGGFSGGDMIAYDAFRSETVVFGAIFGTVDGTSSSSSYYTNSDGYRFVWRWNGAQWQADPPSFEPGIQNYQLNGNLVYDPFRSGILLFGGEADDGLKVTNCTFEILYQDEPAVLQQPTVQTALKGQPAQIYVYTDGAPVISYQWQKDGVNLGDTANLTGSQTNYLNFQSVTAADSGNYTLTMLNICGYTLSQPIQFIVTAGPISLGKSSGGAPSIIWNNIGAVLQSAPSIDGPWTAVPGATSPYTLNIAPGQAYYRLVQ